MYTGWIGIRIKHPSGATRLSADSRFSECTTNHIRLSSHLNVTCSVHDIVEKLLT